jgi:hypothetical protein
VSAPLPATQPSAPAEESEFEEVIASRSEQREPSSNSSVLVVTWITAAPAEAGIAMATAAASAARMSHRIERPRSGVPVIAASSSRS